MRVWAEIDLGAIRRNLAEAQSRLRRGCAVLAVVKANAYGHGAVPIAREVVQAGAAYLGVASAAEGAVLRDSRITAPILVLGAMLDEELEMAAEHGLTPTLCSPEQVVRFGRLVRSRAARSPFHVKVDTGMRRSGTPLEKLPEILDAARSTGSLFLEGIYTHFPSSETEELSLAEKQLDTFEAILRELAARGVRPPIAHVSNSGAIFTLPRAQFDLVRQGITLYGLYPSAHLRKLVKLTPALSLKTRIVLLRLVPPGTGIGYNHTFVTQRPTLIATLPIGYADGYSVRYSNRASVIVRGRRVPVIGRVSMDYTTADVTDLPDVAVGDVVTVIGRDADEQVSVEELADLFGTVPHEVTCSIGQRVERVYLR